MVAIERRSLDIIANEIIKDVSRNKEQVLKLKLTLSEADALAQVAMTVYNYLCSMEERGMKFGKDMQNYMTNLREGYEKLNNAC
jgi:hypothetical protein